MSEDQLLHTLEGMRRMTEGTDNTERADLKVGIELDPEVLEALRVYGEQMRSVANAFYAMCAKLAPAMRRIILAIEDLEREHGPLLAEMAMTVETKPILDDPAPPSPPTTAVPIAQARRRVEAELSRRGPAVDLDDEADAELTETPEATDEDDASDNCPHDAPCKGGDACCRAQGKNATQAEHWGGPGIPIPVIGGAGAGCSGPCCTGVQG